MAEPGVLKSPAATATTESPPIDQERSATQHANGKVIDKSPSSKKKDKKPQGEVRETELSGAEIKKRAKEEKAARRAKQIQEKQVPSQSTVPGQSKQNLNFQPESGIKKDVSGQATPKQQKRRGSATAKAQQQLPIRTSEHQTATASPTPKRDSHNVSLFSHLYGQPRRTSMTGAGKDIHSAVVTLGLKMSHYIICGSNARCVAMLLAFKRVRLCIRMIFIC